MRSSFVIALALSILSTVIASPIEVSESSEDLAKRNTTGTKRGNGSEIWYILTCNGNPHVSFLGHSHTSPNLIVRRTFKGSTAAYYSNWQNSMQYGQHWPNTVGWSGNPGDLSSACYDSDSDFDVCAWIGNKDPGWYNIGGSKLLSCSPCTRPTDLPCL